MLHTLKALGGMAVAPHHLAAQAGRDVLKEGGNAVEAMVAAAATIAVVYPHMNAIGGDGFWLIHEPGKAPVAIDACGRSGARANLNFYSGMKNLPTRGPLAALTTAGTISGWQLALEQTQTSAAGLPLSRLLEAAIHHARDGIAVTASQSQLTEQKLFELKDQPGFAETFLIQGQAPAVGALLRQTDLARTLEQLAQRGLMDFYQGELGQHLGQQLEKLGSPLTAADLSAHQAQIVQPLALKLKEATLYNMTPPTQGLASLIILGLFERFMQAHDSIEGESFAHLHGLIESTKQAFLVRDAQITDPDRLLTDPQSWLATQQLDALAAKINPEQALPWPHQAAPGDTVWMGAIDRNGMAVSFIQSVYWEFGSGVVLPETGVCWQNRGISFALDPSALNSLEPGRKPFHTLNPALALFDDGRVMPYGTMGGEGQPQTQAAIFSRYALFKQALQQAVTAPRWLLGRTWGDTSTSLKLENRFAPELVQQLQAAGHQVEVLNAAFSDTLGHAGALVRHPNGLIEGASDPRSDGAVAGV